MTAEEYISAILDDLNATSKTEFACEGFSAALWSCTLRTAAHWYPDTVTTLLSTYPGVASIMVANDTSMVGSLQDAVEDWICKFPWPSRVSKLGSRFGKIRQKDVCLPWAGPLGWTCPVHVLMLVFG